MKKIFLVFLVSCAFALNMTIDMQTKTLGNGLKVVVLPDHRSPLAWFQIWYDVGSSDEHNGLTGISHALEHMMFKGTKKHGPGQLTKLVDLNGGSHNAFTSRDYTCYWEKLPSDKLELGFELESDRMKNLVLTEKDFVSEQKVILEERRMRIDDNPISLTNEQFSAALKLATPYQDPVIGWERDI
ncbi:MAG: pitrilysin family protein, partial [Pseudomonadota bacterium]|nr:pitrilysin family protein [Pseudomonadota bacterium]